MANCELIDFTATQRTGSRQAANVRAAMEEAAQISDQLQRDMAKAHLAALAGCDAAEYVGAAQDANARLGKQLRFAAALAERAQLRSHA